MTLDHRPLFTVLLGSVLLLVSLYFLWVSFKPDAARLYRSVQTKSATPINPVKYAYHCAPTPKCRLAYWEAWHAGNMERTLLASGLALGALLSSFGSVWKPEVTRTRLWRHHGQQQVNLPPKITVVTKADESRVPWPPQRPRGI